MKRFYFPISFCFILFIFSCTNEEGPFTISKDSVGKLTKYVPVNELEALYAEDSIVVAASGAQNIGNSSEIEIYEKGGPLLLVLQPVQEFDTTSTIANIQILDPRFKTKEGISIKSTFGDILKEYKVSRIENTLSSAVVFIDEINAYITIDKKQLPSELRFDTDTRIEASQIPDDANIKFFMIGWD